MTKKNQTIVTEFLLLHLPIKPEQGNLFGVQFLAMYITTVLGNRLIFILIGLDSHLYVPICFSLTCISLTSAFTWSQSHITAEHAEPSPIHSLSRLPGPHVFSLGFFFFFFFRVFESFLLVIWAYDHYVALCFPLPYTTMRSLKLCVSWVALPWVLTTTPAMLHTLLMARLSFCADHVIPHFFCNTSTLLKLSCSDSRVNGLVMFYMGGLNLFILFLLIIMSYARIVPSTFKVLSAGGICKAFPTCGSHLSVVSLFYGTVIGFYIRPSADNSTVKERVMAVMYTVVTPLLNPFIYSLRNRDMKGVLGKSLLEKENIFFSKMVKIGTLI